MNNLQATLVAATLALSTTAFAGQEPVMEELTLSHGGTIMVDTSEAMDVMEGATPAELEEVITTGSQKMEEPEVRRSVLEEVIVTATFRQR